MFKRSAGGRDPISGVVPTPGCDRGIDVCLIDREVPGFRSITKPL
jgi:hypothetical protein